MTPVAVPTTITLAPIIGSPFASLTVPVTFTVFCCTLSKEGTSSLYPFKGTDKNKNNKIATGNNRHSFGACRLQKFSCFSISNNFKIKYILNYTPILISTKV